MHPYMDMLKTKGRTKHSGILNSSSLVSTSYLVEPEIVPSMEHIDTGKSENIGPGLSPENYWSYTFLFFVQH